MGSFNGKCYLTKENYSYLDKCHIFMLVKISESHWNCSGYAFGKYNDYGYIYPDSYEKSCGSELSREGDSFLLQLSEAGFEYAKNISADELKHLPVDIKITYDEEISEDLRVILENTIRISGREFATNNLTCYGCQPYDNKKDLSKLKEISKVFDSIKIKDETVITNCSLSKAPIYDGDSFKQVIFAHMKYSHSIDYVINVIDCRVEGGKIIEEKSASDDLRRGTGVIDEFLNFSTINVCNEFFDYLAKIHIKKIEEAETIKYPVPKRFVPIDRSCSVKLTKGKDKYELCFQNSKTGDAFTDPRRFFTASKRRSKELLIEYLTVYEYRSMLYVLTERSTLCISTNANFMLPVPVSLFLLKKNILANAIKKVSEYSEKYSDDEDMDEDDEL